MIDYTKLRRKLIPEQDGEPATHLRTGVVSVVNTDGTLDIVMSSGVTVPGVPRLAGVVVQVGGVVQMISLRGSLLVIGQVLSSTGGSGAGLWTRVRATSSSSSMTTTLTAVLTTPTVTFLRNRVYEIKSHGGVNSTSAGALAELRAFRSGGATLGEWYRIPCTTTAVFNATLAGIYFGVSNAGNVSGAVQLQMSVSAGNGTHYANSSSERNLEVWDAGDLSQFPGIQTW